MLRYRLSTERIDGAFTLKIVLDHVVVGDLGGQLFSGNGDAGKMVGQRAGGNTETFLHSGGSDAAEQGSVALRSHASDAFARDSVLVHIGGEELFRFGEPIAGGDAGNSLHALFDKLLLAGLQGEVALGKGNFLFARIAVFGNEVTGVAGEHVILDGTTGATSKFDYFTDVSKMILNRRFCLLK